MTIPTPQPAAAVIFLRDGSQSLEVLLVRRSEAMAVHGGSWVFPGGKVDAEDVFDDSSGELHSARAAAVREVREETGIHIAADALHPFSHWTTSTARSRRFSTWFFVASVGAETTVRVDGTEIVDHRWQSIDDVLSARERGEMVLPPAPFIALEVLRAFTGVDDLPGFVESHPVERFVPKIVPVAEGEVALYEGDAGYDALELQRPGARHRLYMLRSGWRYERSRDTA